MKMRLIILALLVIGSTLAMPSAQALNVPSPAGISTVPTPLTNTTDVQDLVKGAIQWIFWGLIVLSVIMALVSAYKYVTAAGDPDKVSSASKTLLYAAIGVAVALVAAGVPLIVESFLCNGGSC